MEPEHVSPQVNVLNSQEYLIRDIAQEEMTFNAAQEFIAEVTMMEYAENQVIALAQVSLDYVQAEMISNAAKVFHVITEKEPANGVDVLVHSNLDYVQVQTVLNAAVDLHLVHQEEKEIR